MQKTIELINRWGEFAERHPGASIEDFCRYQLIHTRESNSTGALAGGVVPHTDGLLLRIIGRINKLNMTYAHAAFENTGVTQMEEFGLLLTIQQHKHPKKSEVIYACLLEVSSGTDMLNRLKAKGFLKEINDKTDKRSKRLELTAQGEKVIAVCQERIGKLAKMMLAEMGQDDKRLCIQLLKETEMKFSALFQGHKGKSFDEIYKEVMGKK